MVSQEVVFELEPEGAQGVWKGVPETKGSRRAHAPTTGKTFLGTLLGRKDVHMLRPRGGPSWARSWEERRACTWSLVVRRGRSRRQGTRGQCVCQTTDDRPVGCSRKSSFIFRAMGRVFNVEAS